MKRTATIWYWVRWPLLHSMSFFHIYAADHFDSNAERCDIDQGSLELATPHVAIDIANTWPPMSNRVKFRIGKNRVQNCYWSGVAS